MFELAPFSCVQYLYNLDKKFDYCIFESFHQKGANKVIKKWKKKQQKNNVFEISTCVAKRQKMNPKHKTTPGRSKAIRRKGTFDACMFIHRGTLLNKAPFLEGILDTMKCKFKIETVTKMIIFDSSNLSTNFKKKVVGK